MSAFDDIMSHINDTLMSERTILGQESMPKFDRIVFGIGIGPDCYCKNPSEALVLRLSDFESDLRYAKTEEEKQEIIKERAEFLMSFKQELLPGENVEEILKLALAVSQQQEVKYEKNALQKEKELNEDKGFINALGKAYVDDVSREISSEHTAVSKLLMELIEKEQDFIPE